MKSDSKLLLNTFRKEKTSHVPFWFMRQAGRYLPEYKELRGTEKNFIEFCLNPKKASEATLQPVRRFGMDGAIIFSDILVVPYALGVDVRFEEGKGPLLVPVTDETGLTRLILRPEKLEPVYEALKLTKAALPDVTTLIGFTGYTYFTGALILSISFLITGIMFFRKQSPLAARRIFYSSLLFLSSLYILLILA